MAQTNSSEAFKFSTMNEPSKPDAFKFPPQEKLPPSGDDMKNLEHNLQCHDGVDSQKQILVELRKLYEARGTQSPSWRLSLVILRAFTRRLVVACGCNATYTTFPRVSVVSNVLRRLVEEDAITCDPTRGQPVTYSDALHRAIENAITELTVFMCIDSGASV
jgi:hypothetical protein